MYPLNPASCLGRAVRCVY